MHSLEAAIALHKEHDAIADALDTQLEYLLANPNSEEANDALERIEQMLKLSQDAIAQSMMELLHNTQVVIRNA